MSLVMRSQPVFSDENGRLLQYSNVRSCNCCPYGYHIDLDFVRYCEALANARPSEEELQRRSRRRSRKSMEFMLGLDNIFDEWDASTRVQTVPEAETETESLFQSSLTNSLHHGAPVRQRSSSISFYPLGRSDSPFGTASSTCSSVRATESDAGLHQFSKTKTNIRDRPTQPETKALLTEALVDVCDDFERTLERTSMKRKKLLTSTSSLIGKGLFNSNSDSNNNQDHDLLNGFTKNVNRSCNAWDLYFDLSDSCIGGNKSPTNCRVYNRSNTLPFQKKLSPAELQYESYVQATVAANSKSPVEFEPLSSTINSAIQSTGGPPPPAPPRRHNYTNKSFSPASLIADNPKSASSDKGLTTNLPSPFGHLGVDNSIPDAQTLYNIRQQMALSLKRMKDLEEQVKTIPEMQLQLTQLRNEKQRLEQKLQNKEEELFRARDIQRLSSSPSPAASPKFPSPVQFTPQRISPISLESLGNRIRTNSTSSEKTNKFVMKRDVGVMCSRTPTREVAVGSPKPSIRSVATSPAKEFALTDLSDPLYSKAEVDTHIKIALNSFEQRFLEENTKTLVSVGTQMWEALTTQRTAAVQTQTQKPVAMVTVGLNAIPKTRETFTSCRPDIRSIGSSEDKITDVLCETCSKMKKSVACSTDEISTTPSRTVSLRQLDLPIRSNTFSLGENEKLNLIRKSIGTQCKPLQMHTTGCQTLTKTFSSLAIQNVPICVSAGFQSTPDIDEKATDTRDLVRLTATKILTEEISAPSSHSLLKSKTRSLGTNTDQVKTVNSGVNPLPSVKLKHAASNTDKTHKKDQACGDVIKPHISIACADNYCDSCKDAIKNLAKDFSKTTPPVVSPVPSRNVDSRIPRPKNLPSPSPVRKTFSRQNTYTIDTPATTPTATQPSSSKPEKESQSQNERTLHEKPPTIASFHQEASANENQELIAEPRRKEPSRELSSSDFNLEEDERSVLNPSKSLESYNLTRIGADDLIVREEKKVTVSWSRDASPAPLASSQTSGMAMSSSKEDSPTKSFQNTLNEKLEAAAALAAAYRSGNKSTTSSKMEPHSSQMSTQNEREQGGATSLATDQPSEQTSEVLLQKLALDEEKPREKFKPPNEVMSALKQINESLMKKMGAKPLSSSTLKSAKEAIQNEWFRVSSTDKSDPHQVEDYLDCFEALSVSLLEYCVNMTDANGNTAMHYAVSHGNFDVVSILLDSKVCNVNQMNNAGYTSVMLVSLAKLKNPSHRIVVERLFQMADVNVLAKKHSQTALMLAVSHGNMEMVEMLLAAGADVNIQDEDGSTALMCAAEHGRIDLVKHLLSQSECNSLIQDVDGSTAFKIAWQAGHKDIGMLLYIHEQMLKAKLPNGGQTSPRIATTVSPTHLQQLHQQLQLQKQMKMAQTKTKSPPKPTQTTPSTQAQIKRQSSAKGQPSK